MRYDLGQPHTLQCLPTIQKEHCNPFLMQKVYGDVISMLYVNGRVTYGSCFQVYNQYKVIWLLLMLWILSHLFEITLVLIMRFFL